MFLLCCICCICCHSIFFSYSLSSFSFSFLISLSAFIASLPTLLPPIAIKSSTLLSHHSITIQLIPNRFLPYKWQQVPSYPKTDQNKQLIATSNFHSVATLSPSIKYHPPTFLTETPRFRNSTKIHRPRQNQQSFSSEKEQGQENSSRQESSSMERQEKHLARESVRERKWPLMIGGRTRLKREEIMPGEVLGEQPLKPSTQKRTLCLVMRFQWSSLWLGSRSRWLSIIAWEVTSRRRVNMRRERKKVELRVEWRRRGMRGMRERV